MARLPSKAKMRRDLRHLIAKHRLALHKLKPKRGVLWHIKLRWLEILLKATLVMLIMASVAG